MQKTQHYELKKPDVTDPLRVADLNENSDRIDAALASKADAEALAALENIVSAKGNCKIAYGSYTGNGKYGSSNPTTLTVGFAPVLVLILDAAGISDSSTPVYFIYGCSGFTSFMSSTTTLNWSSTGVSWYNSAYVDYQYNASGHTYYYCALGYSNG